MAYILQFEDNPRPPIESEGKPVTSVFYFCGSPQSLTKTERKATQAALEVLPNTADCKLYLGTLMRLGGGMQTDNPTEATRFSWRDASAVFNAKAYFKLFGMKLVKKPVPPSP